MFEQFLDMAPDTSAHDTIRQSVIILMGCLARHLDKDDPKVRFSCKNHPFLRTKAKIVQFVCVSTVQCVSTLQSLIFILFLGQTNCWKTLECFVNAITTGNKHFDIFFKFSRCFLSTSV